MDNTKISMRNFILNQFNWISRFSPSFYIHGSQISVLNEPEEFYSKLQELTNSSKRIVLASLYFGTGQLEQQMIENLRTSLLKKENKNLQIKVVLDYKRGSRGAINSRTMFLPLIQSHPHNLQVSLFHSPLLSGFLKKILPDRFNEVMGLFHMKIYIGDDDIIISGANLSESYFTDRQDRYILISKCSKLSNYFDELLSIVSEYSFQLQGDGSATFKSNNAHPFRSLTQNKIFCNKLKQEINCFIEKWKILSDSNNSMNNQYDTVLYPLIQMGPMGVTQDQLVTTKFLSTLPSNSRINIATGYFNLTPQYIHKILKNNDVAYSIITAAPQANSFYQSSGISGYITDVYTSIVRSFYYKVVRKTKTIDTVTTDVHASRLNTSEVEPTAEEGIDLLKGEMKMATYGGINFIKPSNSISFSHSALENSNTFNENIGSIVNDSQIQPNNSVEFENSKLNSSLVNYRIKLFEYERNKWTFHAKGLWLYPQDNCKPNLIFVGSSNFGCRSVERDMEAQLIIITENKELQNQLHNEQDNLFKHGSMVTSSTFKENSRRVPLWVSIALVFISNFF